MSYAVDGFLPGGMTWRELFDVIIVSARKPEFFGSRSPLFEVVSDDGLLRPALSLASGGAFLGGNAALVEHHLGLSGDEILYIGDHIYGDVHVSKSILRWRTGLIVRELESEIAAEEAALAAQEQLAALMVDKDRLEQQHWALRLAVQRIRADYGPRPDASEADLTAKMIDLRAEIAALDTRISPLARAAGELENQRWGLLMRAGNDKSHLARQVERSADIYTSRVSNFLLHTPFAYLRPPRGTLPHDVIPAPPGPGVPEGAASDAPSMPLLEAATVQKIDIAADVAVLRLRTLGATFFLVIAAGRSGPLLGLTREKPFKGAGVFSKEGTALSLGEKVRVRTRVEGGKLVGFSERRALVLRDDLATVIEASPAPGARHRARRARGRRSRRGLRAGRGSRALVRARGGARRRLRRGRARGAAARAHAIARARPRQDRAADQGDQRRHRSHRRRRSPRRAGGGLRRRRGARAPAGPLALHHRLVDGGAPRDRAALDPARSAREQLEAMFKRSKRLKLGGAVARKRLAEAESAWEALAEMGERAAAAESYESIDALAVAARKAAPREFTLGAGVASGGADRDAGKVVPSRTYRVFRGESGARILAGKGRRRQRRAHAPRGPAPRSLAPRQGPDRHARHRPAREDPDLPERAARRGGARRGALLGGQGRGRDRDPVHAAALPAQAAGSGAGHGDRGAREGAGAARRSSDHRAPASERRDRLRRAPRRPRYGAGCSSCTLAAALSS